MSKRDRRQKASDVSRESEFVFATKGSFYEAFPEIEDLTVEVEESGRGVSERHRSSIYRKQNLPGEYIDCSNPLCYNGGFSMGSIYCARWSEMGKRSWKPQNCAREMKVLQKVDEFIGNV